MISNPHAGWCDFKLGDFEGSPSYLTDVPVDLLNAFIEYHEKGTGIAWFDEEGSEFTLVINPYAVYIIEEEEDAVLYDLSNLIVTDIEIELISDIEKDFEKWVLEFVISDKEKEVNEHREEISEKLKKLKCYINR